MNEQPTAESTPLTIILDALRQRQQGAMIQWQEPILKGTSMIWKYQEGKLKISLRNNKLLIRLLGYNYTEDFRTKRKWLFRLDKEHTYDRIVDQIRHCLYALYCPVRSDIAQTFYTYCSDRPNEQQSALYGASEVLFQHFVFGEQGTDPRACSQLYDGSFGLFWKLSEQECVSITIDSATTLETPLFIFSHSKEQMNTDQRDEWTEVKLKHLTLAEILEKVQPFEQIRVITASMLATRAVVGMGFWTPRALYALAQSKTK